MCFQAPGSLCDKGLVQECMGQWGEVGSSLNIVYGEATKEFTESGPDFLCYCGFLLFPVTALELCI